MSQRVGFCCLGAQAGLTASASTGPLTASGCLFSYDPWELSTCVSPSPASAERPPPSLRAKENQRAPQGAALHLVCLPLGPAGLRTSPASWTAHRHPPLHSFHDDSPRAVDRRERAFPTKVRANNVSLDVYLAFLISHETNSGMCL